MVMHNDFNVYISNAGEGTIVYEEQRGINVNTKLTQRYIANLIPTVTICVHTNFTKSYSNNVFTSRTLTTHKIQITYIIHICIIHIYNTHLNARTNNLW